MSLLSFPSKLLLQIPAALSEDPRLQLITLREALAARWSDARHADPRSNTFQGTRGVGALLCGAKESARCYCCCSRVGLIVPGGAPLWLEAMNALFF